MGNSGCGKSTFLSAINGFLEENGENQTVKFYIKTKNIKEMKQPN